VSLEVERDVAGAQLGQEREAAALLRWEGSTRCSPVELELGLVAEVRERRRAELGDSRVGAASPSCSSVVTPAAVSFSTSERGMLAPRTRWSPLSLLLAER
jgi:hypothetical protein